MAPKAVLIGMPGSGKSTIGRRLAKAMHLPLLDTDAKIVETTGRSIADIFVAGEREFRRIEEDVVRAALAEHDGILSLGGGAISRNPKNVSCSCGWAIIDDAKRAICIEG